MDPSSELEAIRRSIAPPDRRTITETWVVVHMTETHAQALRDATRHQFAIPAQEKTRRSTRQTVRYGMRVAAVLLVVGVLVGLAVIPTPNPDITKAVIAAIAVIAAVLGANVPEIVRHWRKRVAAAIPE